MANDPGGREKLLALGVRNVPVVSKGESYVFGQNLEDVAEFVGLLEHAHRETLPGQRMGGDQAADAATGNENGFTVRGGHAAPRRIF